MPSTLHYCKKLRRCLVRVDYFGVAANRRHPIDVILGLNPVNRQKVISGRRGAGKIPSTCDLALSCCTFSP